MFKGFQIVRQAPYSQLKFTNKEEIMNTKLF